MDHTLQRLAILYARLNGYAAACQRQLKEAYGVEMLAYYWPSASNAPFEEDIYAHLDQAYARTDHAEDEMLERLEAFEPQAVLMSGWFDRGYLRLARALRRRSIPVISNLDNQWTGSWRQQVARFAGRPALHRAIDVMWVPGERQRAYAHRLGYRGRRCWSGMYACDWARFSSAADVSVHDRNRAFLFVGRYVDVKGLDTLVAAYRRYRQRVPEPWALICAGAGTQAHLLHDVPGIEDRGFVQPDRLPRLMQEAAAFVLPSRKEAWGVVVQEAAAVGLPLICSDACGAAVHLLQDRYNGYLFAAGEVEHLTQCMLAMSTRTAAEREAMGARSQALAAQFTPARWADTMVQGLQAL